MYLYTGAWSKFEKVPRNFMKVLNVDDATLKSQLMTPYRKIDIVREKINYSVTSPSNHFCQINIIYRERPDI